MDLKYGTMPKASKHYQKQTNMKKRFKKRKSDAYSIFWLC